MARDLPENVSVKPFYDQSILIVKSLDHVQAAMLQGAVLIVLVMMLFMWH
jgi:heavy metal efflux system protein